MNTTQLTNEILAVLHTIKDDKTKLEQLLTFMMEEIHEESQKEEIPEKYD